MNEVRQLWTGMVLILALLLVPLSYAHAADFNVMGDVGCKSAAISNLKNLAGLPISFFGAGDYSYKCSNSSIKPLWDQINSKRGVPGNHECEKGQDSLKAGTVLGYGSCSKAGQAYVRGGNTGVLLLNMYTSYKPGSTQYKFIVGKINEWKNNTSITNIVAIFHELIEPVNCSGSHCHGIDKPGFKAAYNQIFKDNHVFVIQAHTHLVAFGLIDGKRVAVCGGGGEDGTGLNGLGKYTFVSNKMGFCNFHFEKDKVVAKLIDTSGKVIQTHTWNN